MSEVDRSAASRPPLDAGLPKRRPRRPQLLPESLLWQLARLVVATPRLLSLSRARGDRRPPRSYTTDPSTRWAYCGIPDCPAADCANGDQRGYRGARDYVPGPTCRNWATLHADHHNHPNQRPNAGLGDHNYCRNPDGHSNAWWSRRRVPRLYRARAATDGPAAATPDPSTIPRRAGRTVTSRPAPPAAPRRTRGEPRSTSSSPSSSRPFCSSPRPSTWSASAALPPRPLTKSRRLGQRSRPRSRRPEHRPQERAIAPGDCTQAPADDSSKSGTQGPGIPP